MSVEVSQTRISPKKITLAKGKTPIVALTAYTSTIAERADPFCDVLLIGDSVGMVLHGMKNTLPITIDEMMPHARAVVAASKRACIVMDMPFGSYEESPEVAFRNAVRVMKETGVSAVKMEGGQRLAATIRFLVDRGVPVMAHIGMLPQMVAVTGSFQAVGRTKSEWPALIADAQAVADAGAFAVVVEGTAEPLAAEITRVLSIPTIGIGASAACDGQILVTEDMLGLTQRPPPFVRAFGAVGDAISAAIESYAGAVRTREFPQAEHTYPMKE
jgi:3-methyl-2-oxobutanoate hydroxymethyltransferase